MLEGPPDPERPPEPLLSLLSPEHVQLGSGQSARQDGADGWRLGSPPECGGYAVRRGTMPVPRRPLGILALVPLSFMLINKNFVFFFS